MKNLRFIACFLLFLTQNLFATDRCKLVSQLIEFRQLIDQGSFNVCSSTCIVNAAQIIHREIKGAPIEVDLKDFLWQQIRSADKKGLHVGTGAHPDEVHLFARQVFKALHLKARLISYYSGTPMTTVPRGCYYVERLDLEHAEFDEQLREILLISTAIREGSHLLLVVSSETLPDLVHYGLHEKRIRIKFIDPNAPDYLATGMILQEVDPNAGALASIRLFLPPSSDLRVRLDYYGKQENFAIMSTTHIKSLD